MLPNGCSKLFSDVSRSYHLFFKSVPNRWRSSLLWAIRRVNFTDSLHVCKVPYRRDHRAMLLSSSGLIFLVRIKNALCHFGSLVNFHYRFTAAMYHGFTVQRLYRRGVSPEICTGIFASDKGSAACASLHADLTSFTYAFPSNVIESKETLPVVHTSPLSNVTRRVQIVDHQGRPTQIIQWTRASKQKSTDPRRSRNTRTWGPQRFCSNGVW